jgi:transcriptional regulator with XRE-family HTH domain
VSDPTIGSELAKRRLALGLEKGQAADRIGMSRTTYSSYERDTQRPSVDVFPALANFLAVGMEEFFALYGATCIAVVRESLERALEVDSDSRTHQTPHAEAQDQMNERGFSASVGTDRDGDGFIRVSEEPFADVLDIPNVSDVHETSYFTSASSVVEVPETPEAPNVAESIRAPEIPNHSKILDEVELRSISEILAQRAAVRTVPEVSVIQENPDITDTIESPNFVKTIEPVFRDSPLIDFREKNSKGKKKKKKGKNGKK